METTDNKKSDELGNFTGEGGPDDIGLSHSMAHYLLTIHNLKEEKGFARITDIARALNLTKGSVSIAVNKLKRKNYVIEEDGCKFLNLSQKGHDSVHKILSGRTLLFYFLRDFLEVSEETASRDSCLMEHLMSAETRDKFFNFMKKGHGHGSCLNFNDYNDFIKGQKGDSYLIGIKYLSLIHI